MACVSLVFAISVAAGEPNDRVLGRAAGERIDNPKIDMSAYLRVAAEAARHREGRRVTEEAFLRMSREPGRSFSMRAAAKSMTSCTFVVPCIWRFPTSPSRASGG